VYSEKWARLFTKHIHTTDPIADKAVDTVYHGKNGEETEDHEAVGLIFRSLVTNCEVVREDMPPCIGRD
jgi:hypothetical protein